MKVIEQFIHVNRWLKLLIGSMLSIAIFACILLFGLEESFLIKQAIILMAVPGAYALIGVVEIVSGVPFVEIAGKWDSLAGWQRGILGLFIVAAFFAAIMFSVVLLTT